MLGRINRTPIIRSAELDQRYGCELYFKCENLQRVGAFKARGATNAVLSLRQERWVEGVATHSSGNHGAALADAARQAGVRCAVVVPNNIVPSKLALMRAASAEVIFCEPTLSAREDQLARLLWQRPDWVEIHPSEDPAVIAGQGTAALELIEDVPDLDALIAPVGGGGLLAGCALAIEGSGRPIRLYGAEPVAAADAELSLRTGVRAENLEPPNTIADGLRTQLGPNTFDVLKRSRAEILLVSEAGILAGLGCALRTLRMIIEPSCATVIAAFDEQRPRIRGAHFGVILTGGNLDLARWMPELSR